MNITEVTKWRPCPSLKYLKQEWPNHNLTVYKLNLATERVKNKGQNVGNIKQPTFFSLSLRKIQNQHLDKTLASKSWQNFSIKFGPKFSKLFGLARSCKERQGGVSWLLERLRESSHAMVTSVKSQQHKWLTNLLTRKDNNRTWLLILDICWRSESIWSLMQC